MLYACCGKYPRSPRPGSLRGPGVWESDATALRWFSDAVEWFPPRLLRTRALLALCSPQHLPDFNFCENGWCEVITSKYGFNFHVADYQRGGTSCADWGVSVFLIERWGSLRVLNTGTSLQTLQTSFPTSWLDP